MSSGMWNRQYIVWTFTKTPVPLHFCMFLQPDGWDSVVGTALFVICRPSERLWSDWQPCEALPASCLAGVSYITILRHGPLPSRSTRAINTSDNSSLHSSSLCCLLTSSYPCFYSSVLEEALPPHTHTHPLVISAPAAGVMRWIRCMSVWVDLMAAALFILKVDPLARISLFQGASSRSPVIRLRLSNDVY